MTSIHQAITLLMIATNKVSTQMGLLHLLCNLTTTQDTTNTSLDYDKDNIYIHSMAACRV